MGAILYTPPQLTIHFGRVMIFIDGPNFYRGLLRTFGESALAVNYVALARAVTHNNRSLVRTYFYDSRASGSGTVTESKEKNLGPDDRKALHDKLANTSNYELRLPDIDHKQHIGRDEVDLRLAVDMIRYGAMRLYDVAVLVSSDEDFVPAISAVKEMGLQVELLYFEGARARLVNSCDRRRIFDKPLIDFLIKQHD
jgi:uncharacterized LabA/DUF88 family protein